MSTYKCVNRQCAEYRKEFTAMHFREARQATGRTITCQRCGQIAQWVNNRPSDDKPNWDDLRH